MDIKQLKVGMRVRFRGSRGMAAMNGTVIGLYPATPFDKPGTKDRVTIRGALGNIYAVNADQLDPLP